MHRKPEQPQALDEVQRSRQIRTQNNQPAEHANSTPTRQIGFAGTEKTWRRHWRVNGIVAKTIPDLAYQAGKKSFDTLVKEAEQEIIRQKINSALQYKASDDELARLGQLQRLNQVQIENLEKQPERAGKAISRPCRLRSQVRHPKTSSPTSRPNVRGWQKSSRDAPVSQESRQECEALRSHLRDVESQTEQLSEVEPQIVQLERAKEIEEKNYKYFQASLEKARVDEALDPSKMPNISVVQSPSMAFQATGQVKKLVLGLAGGGIALGFALAFLIELVLNRTVKRPLELEALLGIPLLLSIPYLNGRNHLRLRGSRAGKKSLAILRANWKRTRGTVGVRTLHPAVFGGLT